MRSITVASFNMHWGRRLRANRLYDVIEVCHELDADVLALQEVWRPDGRPSIAERIADALGYELLQTWSCRATVEPKCRITGPPLGISGTGDSGQALLVRVPHTPIVEHALGGFLRDDSRRAVLSTEVALDDGTVTVCASHFPHLEHISPLLRWRLRGVVPDPHRPAILMGDLNMWRWVTRFVAPGWRETVRGATWMAPRPFFQIDHLLATPSVVATDAQVVPIGGSDHFPIRATITTGITDDAVGASSPSA